MRNSVICNISVSVALVCLHHIRGNGRARINCVQDQHLRSYSFPIAGHNEGAKSPEEKFLPQRLTHLAFVHWSSDSYSVHRSSSMGGENVHIHMGLRLKHCGSIPLKGVWDEIHAVIGKFHVNELDNLTW